MLNSEILDQLITDSGFRLLDIAEVSGFEANQISAFRTCQRRQPTDYELLCIRDAILKLKFGDSIWTKRKLEKMRDMLNSKKKHREIAEVFNIRPTEVSGVIKRFFRYELREE